MGRCWWSALGVGLGLAAWAAGCVERRMTIRTNPPGARVFVDNREIGVSPISYAYTYYGVSRVRLVREGYETKIEAVRIDPPIYDNVFTEVFSEFLPIRFKDWREITFDLEPTKTVDLDELKVRASTLRRDAQAASEQPGRPAGPAGPAIPTLLDPEDPIWFQE